MKTNELFSLEHTLAEPLLSKSTYPWEILGEIAEFVRKIGRGLDKERFMEVEPEVWVAKSASVAKSACICAPAIIDENATVRHCAFIRGAVIVGKGSVVGNSTEVKNSIIFDSVEIPHYNYVGDSVLGYHSHLGAGAITSNVKSDRTAVSVRVGDEKIDTGLRKFGAMVGDFTEVGCNSVLCPGSVIGKGCTVYPLSRVRGYIPEGHIFKDENNIVKKG